MGVFLDSTETRIFLRRTSPPTLFQSSIISILPARDIVTTNAGDVDGWVGGIRNRRPPTIRPGCA